MNNLLKSILYLFLFMILTMQFGCENSTEPDDAPDSGYILSKHLIQTQTPCFVNIMFQVSDMENDGIDYLTTEDFEVFEDNQAVSPTESAMTIKKKDAISYKLKTVILLDNSTSVGNNIAEIKTAAIKLVENIVDKQEIAIYVFSENAILLQDFTSNINNLKNAINSISLGFATTNLYGAIIQGASRWNDYYSIEGIEQGFMIAMTDGSDTQGSSSLNQALSAISNKKVYTIGLGDEIDANALKSLGTAGNFNISDVSELTSKFTDIQDEMSAYANSFYWLYYMSPKRGDNNHEIKLTVKENSNIKSNSYIIGEFSSNGFYSVQRGVVINNGIETLSVNQGETTILTATTYLPNQTPSYSWQTSDENIISISSSLNQPSITINAVGSISESTIITVNDISNSISKSITINISSSSSSMNEWEFIDLQNGISRAHGLTHIPGDYSKRYVVYEKTCYILNWDFSYTGNSFTCSQINNSNSGDWAKGITADNNYLYITTGGKQVERYTHSGQFVDIFINHTQIINAGFSDDGYFSVCDITVAGDNLILTGGPIFHTDNIALFNKNNGFFVSKWDSVPPYPYGICWVQTFNYDSISCNEAEGCVIVSQFGTSENGGQDGYGPLHLYSPDGSIFYGSLPSTGKIRQAGLDCADKDMYGNQKELVLWHGFFAYSQLAELLFE